MIELDKAEWDRECAKVARFVAEADDRLRAQLPNIAEILVTAVSDEFETSGRGLWPPLARSTLERKRRLGLSEKPLIGQTGMLSGNVRPRSGADYAMAWTDVAYGIFHVSDAPRKKIPKRDFLDVDEDAVFGEVLDLLLSSVG